MTARHSTSTERRQARCSACRHYVFMVITHNCVHGFVDPRTCGRFSAKTAERRRNEQRKERTSA